ncbi:MAG: C25 family cysteine peptidase [Salinivirgaceae bacterium]|jgi:hypothetical protein|nr:C25 family cysteine peptidase [Salinivirgaceae bacterium]
MFGMRRAIVILILLSSFAVLMAQRYTVELKSAEKRPSKVIKNNNKVVYHFSYPGIEFKEINTKLGLYNQMFVPNTYRSGRLGEPQLISTQKLISIPANAEIEVRVISYTTDEIKVSDYFADNKLLPYQPSYSKNTRLDDHKLVLNKASYEQNSFSKNELATLKVLGTLRDTRIAKLTINPTAYNPVLNTLKVYNNIEVELIIKNTTKAIINKLVIGSPYFNNIQQKIEPLISSVKYADHPDLTTYPVKYLIVAPNEFIDGLGEFIHWKTQKGFNVVVGNMDSIGSAAADIKTWVHNQYTSATVESPAPSFLLLVGDIEQVPASQNGNKTYVATDLYYASVDGDMFPDMYYGRMPAQNTIQLEAMLAKTLYYEQYKFANDDFLNDVTFIAGADDTWNTRVGQPTINYGTTNYFNTTQGFLNVNAYLSSYTGCYNSDKIAVSMINYTAHCGQTFWQTPFLGASTVSAFNNTGKYPVAIGNCCTSGDFTENECIGEAFVRNPNGGAVAYIGSVPDTYWWEDFYWAVGAHAPVYTQYPDSSASSLGVYDAPFKSDYLSVDAMVFVGNLAVTEAHNEGYLSDINSQYYWEAYHCLGDPALVPFFTKGKENVATHDSVFSFGSDTFEVKTSPGSLVAISNSQGIIGTGLANVDSLAIVKTDSILIIDSVTIVITKPKFKPYIKTIPMGAVQGTFLVVKSVMVNDSLGNSNGNIDFNEQVQIDLSLENIGDQVAENIWASVTCSNPYVEDLSENIKISVNNIGSEDSLNITGYFNILIKDSVPDLHDIVFNITLSDSVSGNPRDFYKSSYNDVLHAPKIEILSYQLIDDFSGNGNNSIDYGETATLTLGVANTGSAPVSISNLLSNNSINGILQINNSPINSGVLLSNGSVFIDFEIFLPNTSAIKTQDTLDFIVKGLQYVDSTIIYIPIGQDFFVELGDGVLTAVEYPFYNHYKINNCQLLYKNEEMGVGVKALTSIAFNINRFTPDMNYRDLKDFTIKIINTNAEELDEAVLMDDAVVSYIKDQYILPAQTGWEKFDLQVPLLLTEGKNVIFEIAWGQTDNYADETLSTAVLASATPYKSVVWGADDNTTPAPWEASSCNRPNTQFEFDSVGILNFTVWGDLPMKNSFPVQNCLVTVGDETTTTDSEGRAKHYFVEYEGSYEIAFEAYGYYDTSITVVKTQTYEHVDIQIKRHPELTLVVQNAFSAPIMNVAVTIDGKNFVTNSVGEIVSYATSINTYANYTINHQGYHALVDSIFLNAQEKTLILVLQDKFSSNTIKVLNTLGQAITNVKVIIDTTISYTNELGMVTYNQLLDGDHSIQFYHSDYAYLVDTLDVGEEIDTSIFTLTSVGSVLVTMSNGFDNLADFEFLFNDSVYTTNSRGIAEIAYMGEGSYVIKIDNDNYCDYTDTITVFGDYTSVFVELEPKPDIQFYVHNSKIAMANVHIVFDTIALVTDSLGSAQINNQKSGSFPYSINMEGYYPINDTLKLGSSDTILNILLVFIPDLVFEIQGENLIFSEVPIFFENDTLYANSNGLLELPNIGNGKFKYTINQEGYYKISDSVAIENQDVYIEIKLVEIPDVKFIVSHKQEPVSGATVKIKGLSKNTDNLGETLFTNIEKGEYSIRVEKHDFVTQEKQINIYNADTTVYVELKQLPDVKFVVMHNGEPLQDAKILIDTTEILCNTLGEGYFIDVAPSMYFYKVECRGFVSYWDSITVENYNIIEYVELTPEKYSVTFTVSGSGSLIDSAHVNFNDESQYTDVQGETQFNNILGNSVCKYSIYKPGYTEVSDSLMVIDRSITLSIDLIQIVYDVSFVVFDDSGAVNGANIWFDNHTNQTDDEGLAIFNEIAHGIDKPYYVRKDDTHISDTGFVTLVCDTVLDIDMEKIIPVIGINNEVFEFKLYPNPTHGLLHIDADIELLGTRFIIINQQGKVVKAGEVKDKHQIIELIGLEKGIYHIRFKVLDTTITETFILEE